MSELVIYHNPRCSKSRGTLELLERRGLTPRVVEYLKTPPTTREIAAILKKLGVTARALMRTQEAIYTELNLQATTAESSLIQALHDHPALMERPIVIVGDAARIGRPPETVLEILP
ncbi:MAG: arsenate reductase (glutaredoxin) [Gammaproteobacteria bacterium]|nr:arsenate reductase (glutaredoxin) [Gammaproteobacteria bacterium]